jgi:hypothetical protein
MNACRKKFLVLVGSCLAALISSANMHAQQRGKAAAALAPAANREMERLAKALAGDWDTTETMEKSEFFPNGGGRHGMAHVYLAAGGTILVDDVHSDGSAGKLDGFVVIWWDTTAKHYGYFTCFNDPKNPCRQRGSAHWEGDVFVNDYQELVNGKMTKCRDSFVNITPNSHTLVAAMDTGNGAMRTLITTTSKRR